MKAFFNYDMNLYKWREYCKRVEQYRLQYTMQVGCSQSGCPSHVHYTADAATLNMQAASFGSFGI